MPSPREARLCPKVWTAAPSVHLIEPWFGNSRTTIGQLQPAGRRFRDNRKFAVKNPPPSRTGGSAYSTSSPIPTRRRASNSSASTLAVCPIGVRRGELSHRVSPTNKPAGQDAARRACEAAALEQARHTGLRARAAGYADAPTATTTATGEGAGVGVSPDPRVGGRSGSGVGENVAGERPEAGGGTRDPTPRRSSGGASIGRAALLLRRSPAGRPPHPGTKDLRSTWSRSVTWEVLSRVMSTLPIVLAAPE